MSMYSCGTERTKDMKSCLDFCACDGKGAQNDTVLAVTENYGSKAMQNLI